MARRRRLGALTDEQIQLHVNEEEGDTDSESTIDDSDKAEDYVFQESEESQSASGCEDDYPSDTAAADYSSNICSGPPPTQLSSPPPSTSWCLYPPRGGRTKMARRWSSSSEDESNASRPRVTPPPARGLTPARQTPSRRSCRSRVMPHFLFMFPVQNYYFKNNCVLIA